MDLLGKKPRGSTKRSLFVVVREDIELISERRVSKTEIRGLKRMARETFATHTVISKFTVLVRRHPFLPGHGPEHFFFLIAYRIPCFGLMTAFGDM